MKYMYAIMAIELVMLGFLLTCPKASEKVINSIDLGIKIILTFITWAVFGGSQSYTITTEVDGEVRTIEIP